MQGKYIVALDQGTTSSRTVVLDQDVNIVAVVQREFPQIYPRPGWVEHDPRQIWATQSSTLTEALASVGISSDEVAAIGITNQRETTVVWEKDTGKPVYNAIVWQCRRTAQICDELRKNEGFEEYVRENTGLLLDPYFSGTKIKWILDNVPGAREKAEKGQLLFGTIDTWLIWNMTQGRVHVTDYTNASRTMLFNIHKLEWDEHILSMLGIPRSMLPEVKPSSTVYGQTNIGGKGGTRIPIAGIAGDQQAALFGHLCVENGMAKNTYGTGCFMLMNTGKTAVSSKNGLITTLACGPRGEACYALEGSIFVGGSAIQWLRDELKIVNDARDTEYFANKAETSNDVYDPGLHRSGRSLLGSLCPRRHRGPDPRHQRQPHHPRHAGIHRLPEQGRHRSHAGGFRHPAAGPACGRRRQRQQLPDAVPVRHPGRQCGTSRHAGSDGPGCCFPGRSGCGVLERPGRRAQPPAHRTCF